MIDEVDRDLQRWVQATAGTTAVTLHLPGQNGVGEVKEAERGVSCYLLELADKPSLRHHKRVPLQLSLRYLITTWAQTLEEAHRLLGELVFAAMDTPEFEVDLQPLPVGSWQALGIVPQASFILKVPLRKARAEPELELVRKPLSVRAVPIGSLSGVVLGPEELPLMGALVEIPALQLATRTDAAGYFSFSTVPKEGGLQTLRVRTKGQEVTVDVSERESLTIHVELVQDHRKEQ